LPRVTADDTTFGTTYQERTKQFRQFYIREYAAFKAEEGDAGYYSRLLKLNYVLKGPVLEWYMRVKMKLEKNYEIYNRLMPRSGEILDLGCGYGFISYTLMFTSVNRKVTGVDFDAGKISVAANCFSANNRISFVKADISEFEIPSCIGYLLCDVMHYLEPDKQESLLRSCCRKLLPGGIILVREANADLTGRHKGSLLTEFFSTRSGFNKTSSPSGELWFTSARRVAAIASEEGLTMEIIDLKKLTSNNLFALRR
jgi:SAM-dependent methyltransferase